MKMNAQEIEEKMPKFLSWIGEQPELPRSLDKILLLRYLKAAEFDLNRAKSLLKNSLWLRHKNPHIFTQRDPWSMEMQNVVKIV